MIGKIAAYSFIILAVLATASVVIYLSALAAVWWVVLYFVHRPMAYGLLVILLIALGGLSWPTKTER